MGLSNKKTTTTSNSTSTSTPTNPDWVTSALQGYTDKVNAIAGTSGSQYVAPTSTLQQQAYTSAGGLTTSPNYQAATDAVNNVGDIQGESLLSGLSNYYNPYEQQVVDTTKADMEADAGKTRATQAANAALNKAFSGSRYGIQEAATEGELSRALGSTLGNLRYQGFNTAANLSSQDADRRQSASATNASNALAKAGLLSSIGAQQSSDERANIGLQSDLGDKQQAQDQAERTADITLAQILGQLYGQGQYGLFQGATGSQSGTSTSNTNSSLLSDIGSVASGIGSLGSGVTDLAKLFGKK